MTPEAPDARSPTKPTELQEYSALVRRVRSAVSEDREASLSLHEMTAAGRTYELVRVVLGSGAPQRVLLSAGIHGGQVLFFL
jgi:hypothetical protein